MGNSLRVLHVVESFASGTLSALTQYVRSTPQLEHHLLRGDRPGEHIPDGEEELFATVRPLRSGWLSANRQIRQVVQSLDPGIVHAHSSIAGGLVRTAIRSTEGRRIVYTPHCFVFERRDISPLARAAYRAMEWLLAANTHVVAACSTHERETAVAWRTCRRAVHVPSFTETVGAPAAAERRSAVVRIVTVGRIGAQKAPEYFADVVVELRSRGVALEALWVGAGDEVDVQDLRSKGISVSGWLPRSEAVQQLAGCDVYVHTARWEGFPISVLEAVAVGLPVLVRTIPAFAHLPASVQASSPAMFAQGVQAIMSGASVENRAVWRRCMSEHRPDGQARRLKEVYEKDWS